MKRKKNVGKKSPRPENTAVDAEMEDVEDLGEDVPERAAGPDRVGNYSIADIVRMMSEISSNSDWAKMERSGLDVVM